MDDDEFDSTPPGRPSWLIELCPPWCTRDHDEDDDPEDRRHSDDGTLVPALLGRVRSSDLHTAAAAGDLLVQRYREIGTSTTWVVVRETEDDRAVLVVSEETVAPLLAALAAHSPGS